MKVEAEANRLAKVAKWLESENQKLKDNRNAFRKKVAEQRTAIATLQSQNDELESELSDLRSKLLQMEGLKQPCDICDDEVLALERDEAAIERQLFAAPTHSGEAGRLMKKKLEDLELPEPKRMKTTEDSRPKELPECRARNEESEIPATLASATDPSSKLPHSKNLSAVFKPRALYVTLPFLANTYSGSLDCLSRRPKNTSRGNANEIFVFANEGPSILPRNPGSEREILTMCTEVIMHKQFRLFCSHRDSNSDWQYKGEYKATFSRRIQKEEFRQMERKSKDDWASDILSKGWNTTIRARILLRMRNMEITNSSIERTIRMNECVLTMKDVLGSFDRGEEMIAVLRLGCVGYDSRFADDTNKAFLWQDEENGA